MSWPEAQILNFSKTLDVLGLVGNAMTIKNVIGKTRRTQIVLWHIQEIGTYVYNFIFSKEYHSRGETFYYTVTNSILTKYTKFIAELDNLV